MSDDLSALASSIMKMQPENVNFDPIDIMQSRILLVLETKSHRVEPREGGVNMDLAQ